MSLLCLIAMSRACSSRARWAVIPVPESGREKIGDRHHTQHGLVLRARFGWAVIPVPKSGSEKIPILFSSKSAQQNARTRSRFFGWHLSFLYSQNCNRSNPKQTKINQPAMKLSLSGSLFLIGSLPLAQAASIRGSRRKLASKFEGSSSSGCRVDSGLFLGGPNDPEAQGLSNKYFDVIMNVGSLQDCQAKCTDRADCKGVEYGQKNSGRCELWKVAIGQMKSHKDYGCYRKVETQQAEDPPTPTIDHTFQGEHGAGCRLDSDGILGGPHDPEAQGISNKYFDVLNMASIEDCKNKCYEMQGCKGFEYGAANNGRCELWKVDIEQLKHNPEVDCFKKVITTDGNAPNELDVNAVYIDIPDMADEDIADVMNWIKKEVTMVRNPFCWKDSYGRGVGTIPGRVADCPEGYTNDGATCRRPTDDIYEPSKMPSCPSGYTNMGLTCYRAPHDIYSPSKVAGCPSGWKNFGLTCTENLGTGGCAAWTPWNCDTFNVLENLGRMTCPGGYFVSSITGRCNFNCLSGYTNTGESCHRVADTKTSGSMTCTTGYTLNKITARCHKNCPSGYTNTGDTCHLPLIVKGLESMTCKAGEEKNGGRCYPAGGNLGSCFANEENDDGLCYKTCDNGYNGVGPVCWQTCDDSQVDCGAGCAKTSLECGMTVAGQVIAPVIVALNIATLGVTDAAADATKTVMVGGKNVAYTSDLGYYALKALNFFQSVNKTGKANPTVISRIYNARIGTKGLAWLRTVKTVATVSAQVYSAQEQYREMFADNFADQTSREIEQELDSHFNPETARFIKKSWADMAMQELAEANGWVIASTALAAASLVDPTGVVGAVEAYAKPVCDENVRFPCTEANLENSAVC